MTSSASADSDRCEPRPQQLNRYLRSHRISPWLANHYALAGLEVADVSRSQLPRPLYNRDGETLTVPRCRFHGMLGSRPS